MSCLLADHEIKTKFYSQGTDDTLLDLFKHSSHCLLFSTPIF